MGYLVGYDNADRNPPDARCRDEYLRSQQTGRQALNLYAASLDASRDHERREFAYLEYLALRARPGETIGATIDRLSDDELRELRAIIYPDDGPA